MGSTRRDHQEYRAGKPHQITGTAGSQPRVSPAQKLRAERLAKEREELDLAGRAFGDPPPSRSALGRKIKLGE